MTGMVISILFVFIVITFSELLQRNGGFSREFTRKFIHIGVAHWWLVAIYLIEDMKYALVPPILFTIVNYISYKKGLIKSMERGNDSSDLGTVYFPISLILLICLTWPGGVLGGDYKYIGALGILTMGYGDGFAAIIGERFGKHRYRVFNNEKSLEGSIGMLILSFLVALIFLARIRHLDLNIVKISYFLAIVATLTEAFTPFGLDNITVPMVASLGGYLMLYLLGSETVSTLFLASIGFTFSFIIAYLAYTKNSLTEDGATGAVIMGTVMCATSGTYGSSILVLFFVSASALSHFRKHDKKSVEMQFEKDGRRDLLQVLANGGVGLIFSIIYSFTKDPIYLVLMGVAFASANADTWATEIGVLNKLDPISLKTFKRVAKGTSGAISLIGTLAALVGALIIGVFSAIALKFSSLEIVGFDISRVPFLVTSGGFLGCMADSLLGATVQGVYYDDELKAETERKANEGKSYELVRGFSFINNDIVNFTSIAIATLLTIAMI